MYHQYLCTFVSVRCLLSSPAQSGEDVEEGLDSREDVEGRGEGGARLEVADPELRPGKLPLSVKRRLSVAVQRLYRHHFKPSA